MTRSALLSDGNNSGDEDSNSGDEDSNSGDEDSNSGDEDSNSGDELMTLPLMLTAESEHLIKILMSLLCWY